MKKMIFALLVFILCVFNFTQEGDTLGKLYQDAMYDLSNIQAALANYLADTSAPDINTLEELKADTFPHYLQNLPMNDPWGNPYLYQKVDDENFKVGCSGSDSSFSGWDQTGTYSAEEMAGKDIILSKDTRVFSLQQ